MPEFGDPAITSYEQLRMLVICRNDGELYWKNGSPSVILRPGKCERCGHWYATEAHHRWLRSQQGPDVASNLAALCRNCHNWAHAHPADAHREGWMLIAGDKPSEVAVTLASGLRTRLRDDGTYEYVGGISPAVTDELRAMVERVRQAREIGTGALAG